VTIGLTEDGLPHYGDVEAALSSRTRLLALAHVSNTTGVVAPVERWVAAARSRGLPC